MTILARQRAPSRYVTGGTVKAPRSSEVINCQHRYQQHQQKEES